MSSSALDSLLMPPPPKRVKVIPKVEIIELPPTQNVSISKDKDDTGKINENSPVEINEEAKSYKLTSSPNQEQSQCQLEEQMDFFSREIRRVDIEESNRPNLPQYAHHEVDALNEEDELSTIDIDQEELSCQKEQGFSFLI